MSHTPPGGGGGGIESFDELLSSSHLSHSSNPASSSSSSLTVRPSTLPTSPESNHHLSRSSAAINTDRARASSSSSNNPRDESRWSGFHLWRQESYDRRQLDRRRLEREFRHSRSSENGLLMRTIKGIRDSRWFTGLSNRGGDVDRDDGDGDSRGSIVTIHQDHDPLSNRSDSNLSTTRLILLTLSLAGAQVAWTLELAYGTPYLLSLGLTKESTSLVWLAGPVTGLIAQPIIGSLSDSSNSISNRRSKYMIGSTLFISISTLTLAYSIPISYFLTDLLGIGLGDWDPKRQESFKIIVQFISILAFWLLDFSLNALQTVSRALILDVVSLNQQSNGNAWQGRMTSIGNIFGYWVGWLNLGKANWLDWIGGGQFRKFSLISIFSLISCVTTTVLTTDESLYNSIGPQQDSDGQVILNESFSSRLKNLFKDILNTIRRLPRAVRRVCLVQFFAFMAWFPFLFYATTYLIGIREREQQEKRRLDGWVGSLKKEDEENERKDRNSEIASFAMLLYAIVSLISGSILPRLALASDSHSTPPSLPLSDSTSTLQDPQTNPPIRKSFFKSSLSKKLSPLKTGLTLRTIWTFGCLFYSFLMLLTFFFDSLQANIFIISMVGISWSIASWIPFSLVGSFYKEIVSGESPFEFDGDHWSSRRVEERRRSMSTQRDVDGIPTSTSTSSANGNGIGESKARNRLNEALRDCQPLGRRSNSPSFLARGNEIINQNLNSSGANNVVGPNQLEGMDGGNQAAGGGGEGGGGGAILGVHNIAIVLPQFVVAIVAAFIFKFTEASPESLLSLASSSSDSASSSDDGTVWVLRFGGLASLFAAFLTRSVPLTQTERLRREEMGIRERVGTRRIEGEVEEEQEPENW